MDWSIEFITALAGLVTAIVALWTVIEVQRQRKSTIKPEISIGSSTLHVYGIQNNRSPDFVFSNVSQDKIHTGSVYSFVLEVFNLGSGPAKAVQLSWDFDVNRALDAINQVGEKKILSVRQVGDWLHVAIPSSEYLSMYTLKNNFNLNLDFVMPSMSRPSQASVDVPDAYLLLYLIYICFRMGFYNADGSSPKNRIDWESFEKFASLYLNAQYCDRDGVTIKKRFKIKFGLRSLGRAEESINHLHHFAQFSVNAIEV